jgi:hypothetical protein
MVWNSTGRYLVLPDQHAMNDTRRFYALEKFIFKNGEHFWWVDREKKMHVQYFTEPRFSPTSHISLYTVPFIIGLVLSKLRR